MQQQREEGYLVSSGESRHQLARVPDEAQFEVMLSGASGAPELSDLRKFVAAWHAVAEKCDAAASEVMRLSVYRLEVERALGAAIIQTVRRGGRGSKSHAATSNRGGASCGLPDGVDKHQSRRYRELAAIPEDEFSAYIAKARESGKPATAQGAHRFAKSVVSGRQRAESGRRPQAGLRMPSDVLQAVGEFMVPGVVVGESEMPGKTRHASGVDLPACLEGDVFVAQCADPASWLIELHRLRESGVIGQVVVALPAEVWADWFKLLETGGWVCCFLAGVRAEDGAGVVLASHGVDRAAFGGATSRVGTVRG